MSYQAARTAIVAAVIALSMLIDCQAFAQSAARASAKSSVAAAPAPAAADPTGSAGIANALATTMRTDAFIRAERANDIKTMRALLSRHGLQVLDPIPEMVPNCQPPSGYPVWAWIYYNGTWMYGWACLRNIKAESIDFSTFIME